MFCKWCGADYPTGANKCKRCGKEVPAMSDCGGFYDLVPKAAIPPVVPIQERKAPEHKQMPAREPEKKTINANPILILLCVILAVAVVVLLVTGGGKDEGEKRDRDGGSSSILDEIVNNEGTEKPGDRNDGQPTEPEDGVQPAEVNLVGQDVRFDIEVTDKNEISVSKDLGKYKDLPAEAMPSFEEELLSAISLKLGEMDDAIVLNINRNRKEKPTSLEVHVNKDLLKTDEALNYRWEVSVDGGKNWESLNTEPEDLKVTYEGEIEEKQIFFRLTYSKTAEEGEKAEDVGSLTVTVPAGLVEYKQKAEKAKD